MIYIAFILFLFFKIVAPRIKKTKSYRMAHLDWKENHGGLTANEYLERSFLRRTA